LSHSCLGAFTADGGEFTGNYRHLSDEFFRQFHRPNIEMFAAESEIDAILFETFPLLREAVVAVDLAAEIAPHKPVIISMSCKDGERLNSGESFAEAVQMLDKKPNVCMLSFSIYFHFPRWS